MVSCPTQGLPICGRHLGSNPILANFGDSLVDRHLLDAAGNAIKLEEGSTVVHRSPGSAGPSISTT